MKMIVICVNFMTLFKHVIDGIDKIDFLKWGKDVIRTFDFPKLRLNSLSSLVWILSFISHKFAGDIIVSSYIKSI